jgi:hypothetical protein
MKRALVMGMGTAMVVGCVALPRDAFACTAPRGTGGCDAWNTLAVVVPLSISGMILSVPSLATNIAVAGWAVGTGGVPTAWSVLGTVLWTAHTAISASSLGVFVWARIDTTTLAISTAYLTVSIASLGFSLWGFTRPFRETPSGPRVAVLPWVSDAHAGLSVGARF